MKVFYLEMLKPSSLIPGKEIKQDLEIKECEIKNYKINRFLYDYVGNDWQWVDKKNWSKTQWIAYAEADDLRTFIAYLKGTPAGYFELRKIEDDVELVYFGLEKTFIGKGLGAIFLTQAVQTAWNWDAKRVWLHTCETDHPNALKNYYSRGFKLYQTREE